METINTDSEIKGQVTSDMGAAVPNLEPSEKRKALFRRPGVWIFGLLLILGFGFIIYKVTIGKPETKVATVSVSRGDVENTVVAAGIIQPIQYVDVGAQTSGKLKSLKVKRGDLVKKGQLLAEIDPELAQSALTSAKATLENMTSQHSLKEAQLVLTKLQRDRNDKLYSEMVISASDHDISNANYEVALDDAASLTAQMKQAQASVSTASANLGYTKITAPMAGDVVSINLLEGQTLNANQSAPNILRIADLDTVTIWSQVSEADISQVEEGQDVYFTVLGQSRRWNGKIRQILPTPELINNVVFYDVLFDIPNKDRDLDIQMTAQVFIVLAQAKNVLFIPTAAVGNAADSSKINVQVLNSDGKIEIRPIKIGIRSEISTEVIEGLSDKEQVVITAIKPKSKAISSLSAKKGL
jgi:membrane fusion protein, macrolide-specific efflux system